MPGKHSLTTMLPKPGTVVVRALKARTHPTSYVMRLGPGTSQSDMITAPQSTTHVPRGVGDNADYIQPWQGFMGQNHDGAYVFVPGSPFIFDR